MASFPIFVNMWEEFTPQDDIQIITDDKAVNERYSVTVGDNMKQNITCVTRPLTVLEKRRIESFFKEVRSRNPFNLSLDNPHMNYVGTLATPNTFFSTNGVHNIGDTIINLAQLPTSSTLPVGSYVQFREGGKVHQVIATTGLTMTILPSLYESVATNTNLILDKLTGRFRMRNGVPTAEQSFIYRFQYSFDFEEELP